MICTSHFQFFDTSFVLSYECEKIYCTHNGYQVDITDMQAENAATAIVEWILPKSAYISSDELASKLKEHEIIPRFLAQIKNLGHLREH